MHSATGKGVTVYVFDGGVSPNHPELAGRVRIGYTGFSDDPKICNPHGTAVAGAIAGATLGVAPDAEIVDVKMVQCEKLRGTIKAIVDGAHWVIEDHKSHPGPAVANWSFIADTSSRIPSLDSAVAELRAAGIPVIVSAGNLDIDACRVSPANSLGAIVVGASALASEELGDGTTHTIDRRAPDTAYGPCIDIYAPGDSVLLPSLDRNNAPDLAAVERHVDGGRLRERRGGAVPRDAPEGDAGRNRRGGRAGGDDERRCATPRRRFRECSTWAP